VRELVTRAEYARLRGVSRAAVTNAVKRGQVQLFGDLVDPVEADRTWPRHADAAPATAEGGAPRSAPPPEPPDRGAPPPRRPPSDSGRPEHVTANAAKADLDWYKAQLASRELAIQDGLLLDAAEVEKQVFEGYRTVRDALQNIPDQLAPALAAETSATVCRRMLETAIRQALNELHTSLQSAPVAD
jgi:hypothetical protein